jgi:low affinity Fe/Cu permease
MRAFPEGSDRAVFPGHEVCSRAGMDVCSETFSRLSRRVSGLTGRPATFLLAVTVIVVWAACGPFVHYSDTWQLVINTATTVVTFLMVFLIQNAQTRDAVAIQLKLDELIRAVGAARNDLIDLEDLDEAALATLHAKYAELAARARQAAAARAERQPG